MKKFLKSVLIQTCAIFSTLGLYGLFAYSTDSLDTKKIKDIISTSVVTTYPIPEDINFAGEKVPMEDVFVQESLEQELILNALAQPATVLYIKRANRWKKEMTEILRNQGIPEDFFYLMIAESGVRNATSYQGAQGYWQFMPATAKECGLEVSGAVDERNDPIKSTYAACKYLKRAYGKFKSWTIVAASYNMGMGGIGYSMLKQQNNNYHELYLNAETARYVYRILAYKMILNNPERYGYRISPSELYQPVPTRKIPVSTTIPNLVTFAKKHNTTFKHLKLLNPWLEQENLPIAPGKTYVLQVPLLAANTVGGTPDSSLYQLQPDKAPNEK